MATKDITLIKDTWIDTGFTGNVTVGKRSNVIYQVIDSATMPTLNNAFVLSDDVKTAGYENNCWIRANKDTIATVSDTINFNIPTTANSVGGGVITPIHNNLKDRDAEKAHPSGSIDTTDTTTNIIQGDNLKENLEFIDQHLQSGGGSVQAVNVAVDSTNLSELQGNNSQELFNDIDNKINKDINDTDVTADTTGSVNFDMGVTTQKKVNQALDSIVTDLKTKDTTLEQEITNLKGSVASIVGVEYLSTAPVIGDITFTHGLDSERLIRSFESRMTVNDVWESDNTTTYKQDVNDIKNNIIFNFKNPARLHRVEISSLVADTNLVTQTAFAQLQQQANTNTAGVQTVQTQATQTAQTVATQGVQQATNTQGIQHNAGNIQKNANHINSINKVTPIYPAGTEGYKDTVDDFIKNTSTAVKIKGFPEIKNLIDGNPNHYVSHTYSTTTRWGIMCIIAFLDSNGFININCLTNQTPYGWYGYYWFFPDKKYISSYSNPEGTAPPYRGTLLDQAKINDDVYMQKILNNQCKIIYDSLTIKSDLPENNYHCAYVPPSSVKQSTWWTFEILNIKVPTLIP